MHILSFIEAFDPARNGGGPVTALRNLIHHGPEDWTHSIFTRNTDYGSNKPLEVPENKWLETRRCTRPECTTLSEAGTASPTAESRSGTRPEFHSSEVGDDVAYDVFYATPQALSQKILSAVRSQNPDRIYLHGAYAPLTRIYLRLRHQTPNLQQIPIILTPHGNLSPAILRHHPLRKHAWLHYSNFKNLYKDLRWHAASEREALQIRSVFGEDAEIVVCGHVVSAFVRRCTRPECTTNINSKVGTTSPTTLITPTRISPEKNLLWGLKLLQNQSTPIHWRIIGSGLDSRYGRELLKQIKGSARVFLTFSPTETDEHENVKNHGLTPLLTIEFLPPVSPEELSLYYLKSDALFLPSRSENFSFVIPEAWQHGLPVLISDQTPWHDLEQKGLGWDLPLTDIKSWYNALTELQKRPQASDRIHAFAEKMRLESMDQIREVLEP